MSKILTPTPKEELEQKFKNPIVTRKLLMSEGKEIVLEGEYDVVREVINALCDIDIHILEKD